MNKGKIATLILISIIIVLVVSIFLQLGSSGSASTTPGSHPQYTCCYSHPSQHEEEPPEDHPSEPEEVHPVVRP